MRTKESSTEMKSPVVPFVFQEQSFSMSPLSSTYEVSPWRTAFVYHLRTQKKVMDHLAYGEFLFVQAYAQRSSIYNKGIQA